MQRKFVLLIMAFCFCLCFSNSAFAAKKKAVTNPVVEVVPVAEVVPAAETQPAAEVAPVAAPVVVPEYEKLLGQASSEEPTQAIATLERAKKLAPENSKVMGQLIGAHKAKGDATAVKQLSKEVLTSNGYGEIRDSVMRQYYESAAQDGSLDTAVSELEQAKLKNPNNTALAGTVIEGNVRLRKWDKVSGGYEELLKKAPDDYVLNTRLIDVYMIEGNYAEVIKRLEPGVQANPGDVGHSDILARAYVGAGMQPEALSLYEKKVASDPNSPGLVGRYAQALMEFGKYAEAQQQWEKAYQLDPSNSFFKTKADEAKAKK